MSFLIMYNMLGIEYQKSEINVPNGNFEIIFDYDSNHIGRT